MRKRLFALAIIAICTIFVIPEVKAAELYYKNDNGVILTKDEYDFFSYMFWEGSQELITGAASYLGNNIETPKPLLNVFMSV